MIKRILYILYIGMFFPVVALSQINTDRVMTIGKNALYFEENRIWLNRIFIVDWPR